MTSRATNAVWIGVALVLTALKLWLVRAQPIFAIGPAAHDDRLFLELAAHIAQGDWLGPYNQLTLAKGPLYPLWLALIHFGKIPLRLVEHTVLATACAAIVVAFFPVVRSAVTRCAIFALLLWNPMSFEGPNLQRVLRQNLGAPLALLVFAGLIGLCLRRRESLARQAPWAVLLGFTFGAFWLTREEGVWIFGGLIPLAVVYFWNLRDDLRAHWRRTLAPFGIVVVSAVLPILTVASLNYAYYGWFGTVEFRAGPFKDAYGALMRVDVGPKLPQVPVTRQAREAIYAVSPTFAELRPFLDGSIGDDWAEKERFPASERQIRGGWFVWALRDSVTAAGHGGSAREAMTFYRRMADEINRACDEGRMPARGRRSGFLPPIDRADLAALCETEWLFALDFFGLRSFSATVRPSEGDDATLRLFQRMTRDRLSPSPHAPVITPAGQEEPYRRRLEWLQTLGERLLLLLRYAVWLAHAVALIRIGESIARRRFSFALLTGIAVWLACMAYVTINALVHVTSYENNTPLAMAMAYPLLPLFAAAIFIDAIKAWMPSRAATPAPGDEPDIAWKSAIDTGRSLRRTRIAAWLWASAAGAVIFALRLREIYVHGSDVPFNDQWIIEAHDLIVPWLDGNLSPAAFFAPHFEHLPVWTRLLAWLQVAITGRWDPLVQMTVNSVIYAAASVFVVRQAIRALSSWQAAAVGLLVIAFGAVPHAWENIAWGFQSQFPIALLCLFVHAYGSFAFPVRSRGWWVAQAAAVAGLLTLASMWLAPVAVIIVTCWCGGIRESRWRWLPLGIALLGIAVIALIHANSPPWGSFAHTSRSLPQFLNAFLHLTGWPSESPVAAGIMNLPLLVLALRLRGAAVATAFDRFALTLGTWAIAQAAALAFARGGDYGGFTSRYGDLLAILPLANALALARLIGAISAWRTRPIVLLLAICWAAWIGNSLQVLVATSHARYFHQNSADWRQLRREAVRVYLARGDASLLASDHVRHKLYSEAHRVTAMLDRPDFRALLPASVNPANPPDAIGTFVRRVQARWHWLALAVGGGWILALLWCSRKTAAEALSLRTVDRVDVSLLAGMSASAIALLLVLAPSLGLRGDKRWSRLISPPEAVADLRFEILGEHAARSNRMLGAADIQPDGLRNLFFGTLVDGTELTCTALSSRFLIESPWLIVPHAGYQVAHGNGLRLRIEDKAGQRAAEEIGCPGPNQKGVTFWAVDVREHEGKYARVVLYDGRTDTDAWVAAAPPIATDDPKLADTLRRQLANEFLTGPRKSLAALAAICGFAAAAMFLAMRRRRSRTAAEI